MNVKYHHHKYTILMKGWGGGGLYTANTYECHFRNQLNKYNSSDNESSANQCGSSCEKTQIIQIQAASNKISVRQILEILCQNKHGHSRRSSNSILNCLITYKHALSVLPSKPLQTKLVHIYGLSKKWDQ